MTTALEAIQSAYPGQYYGVTSTDGATITDVVNVWAASSIIGRRVDLLGLPAASALVPMTEAQSALAAVSGRTGYLTIPARNLTLQYPDRFYCDRNTPCAVYDMWGFSAVPTEPAIGDLYPVTADEYFDRQDNPRQQYYDTASGKLADYVPPPPVVSLKDQAATALDSARSYVNNHYTMLNEATPDAWVTYLKALMAIASGADTTSAALPSQPSGVVAA